MNDMEMHKHLKHLKDMVEKLHDHHAKMMDDEMRGTEKERMAGKRAGKMLKKEVKMGKKEGKIKKVMREFKEDKLHSGSKKGPEVTNPKQAIAIALSEARKVGAKVKPMKKRK